jgi:acyl-CoA synthetase (AMP-forming)/AMP-acid ligase II
MHWRSHQLCLDRFSACGFRPEALATCYAMAENVFAVTQGGIDSPVVVDRIRQADFLASRVANPCRGNEPFIPMLSAGPVIANTRLIVLDDARQELEERRLGEIAIQSNCMLSGYFNRPDITDNAFHDGWFLTGDLGYVSNGEVYITGRKGRVVAFGVFNEAIGTEEVVLIAEADSVSQPEHPANQIEGRARGIADEIRQRVTRGSDIALRYVHIVKRGWLLKTSSGKIARLANRDKYLTERDTLV